MNYVAGGSRSVVRVLVETGSRHMSRKAPASIRRIDRRNTEAGSRHGSMIAPGSRHRLMKTFQSLLAHERMWRRHMWRASADLESTR